MGDILSGGKIDESTSGPIPPKVDDRKTNILGEQKDKQDKDALGGTQFPPRAQPLPPIPEAALVVPSLPSFYPPPPSFSSEVSIDTRETARQAVIDVLKNVTINGQGPSIEGSSISFNVPQETRQNEITFSQPIYQAPPVTPQQPTISQQVQLPEQPQQPAQQLRIQEPQSEGNVISVILEPPKKASTTTYQPDVIEQQIQDRVPPITKTIARPPNLEVGSESDNAQKIAEPQQRSASSQQPTITETQDDRLSAPTRLHSPDFGSSQFNVQSESSKAYQAEDSSRDKKDVEIKPSATDSVPQQKQDQPTPSRLHAPDFGSFKSSDQPERESRFHAADFGSFKTSDQPERPSRVHAADFGSFKTSDQPERPSRIHAADFGSSDFNKESDSAKAYKAAEQRRDEKRESDPNFDRQSRLRQEGETQTEFKERQEKLRKEAEMAKKAAAGDLGAALGSGMVPVSLTRADGGKKILAYISSVFVGVTENPSDGERVTNLPSEDSYYETSADSCVGLSLFTKAIVVPNQPPSQQVWISAGTVGNEHPVGMDPIEGMFLDSSGGGDVWAKISFDDETGGITSVSIESGGSTPQNKDNEFFYTLGHYQFNGSLAQISNYGCGSIDATPCRKWFATQKPYYTLNVSR